MDFGWNSEERLIGFWGAGVELTLCIEVFQLAMLLPVVSGIFETVNCFFPICSVPYLTRRCLALWSCQNSSCLERLGPSLCMPLMHACLRLQRGDEEGNVGQPNPWKILPFFSHNSTHGKHNA